MKTIVIAGGGAAGFFAAINIAEKLPEHRVIILEKSSKLLEKVRISGGGRCNVTHACFEPKQLVKFYPRGEQELLSVFMKFNPTNTIQWFEKKGVKLKRERDGRIFPESNNSETIVNCFLHAATQAGIEINILNGIEKLNFNNTNGTWEITSGNNKKIYADAVVICTGSAAKPWQMLNEIGCEIVPSVPSLFTFNTKDERLRNLAGISLKHVSVEIKNLKLKETGPMLVTHWGLSGPAILRLSAWGARMLHECGYKFEITIDFTGLGTNEVRQQLENFKTNNSKKQVKTHSLFDIPERLWLQIIPFEIHEKKWADVSKIDLAKISKSIAESKFQITGKSTFKDEFVTAGGVNLKQIDFKTMQSKQFSNLYFAGEVLNIDAITGGFNFQAAWSTAWVASEAINKNLK